MSKVKLIRWVGNPNTCQGMEPMRTWDFDDWDEANEERKRDMARNRVPFDNYTID